MKRHHLNISFVFFKILLIFLAVVFPIYFAGLYINFSGQKDIENETMRSATQKINFYANRLDNDFEIVKQSILKLYVDIDVRNLSLNINYPDDYSKLQGVLKLQNRLTEIKNLSEFISEVGIYLPMIGKKVSSLVVQDISYDEFDMFNTLTQDRKYPFIEIDRQKINVISAKLTTNTAGIDTYMCFRPYFSDIMINGEKSPPFLAIVKVNEGSVDRILKEFSIDVQGDGILLSNQNGLDFTGNASPEIINELRKCIPDETGKTEISGITTIEAPGNQFVVAYYTIPSLDSTLLVYIPKAQFFQSLVRYKVWLWAASALTLALVLLFTYLVRALFIRPLDTLLEGFAQVEKGNLDITINDRRNDEFKYLYERFGNMCKRLTMLIEQDYEQKIRVQNAELKQLQCQINPHFLYNSLFILYRMAKMNDMDGVLKISRHLGGYYQFVTKNASDDVTLEEEINHVKDYIQIQTIRYAERIRVEAADTPRDLLGMPVPRLILQPLVENAYLHGLHNKLAGGVLRIHFRRDEELLTIIVEDNGNGMDESALEALRATLVSTDCLAKECGLVNVHRRLLIRYGPGSGLYPEISELGGLRVEMRIVLKVGETHVSPDDCG